MRACWLPLECWLLGLGPRVSRKLWSCCASPYPSSVRMPISSLKVFCLLIWRQQVERTWPPPFREVSRENWPFLLFYFLLLYTQSVFDSVAPVGLLTASNSLHFWVLLPFGAGVTLPHSSLSLRVGHRRINQGTLTLILKVRVPWINIWMARKSRCVWCLMATLVFMFYMVIRQGSYKS